MNTAIAANDVSAPVAAGSFELWLSQARAVLKGDVGSDVPCGECVGCCTSSYFIPIRPQDEAAIAHIPAQYLVSAHGQPAGHKMMGYLDTGACPMLSSGKCTIYRHRPQTCRDYDCRIFAAAGIDAGGPDKTTINQRVQAWQFTYATDAERALHEAVKAAAAFIRARRSDFPGGRAPTAPTGVAVLALKTYALFLDPRIYERSGTEIAMAIIKASGAFDAEVSPTPPPHYNSPPR